MEETVLTWVDCVVIAVTISISVFIGIYYRFFTESIKTTQEYFTTSQSMGTIPVGIALVSSLASATAILRLAAENYSYGTHYVIINLAFVIVTPVVCYGYFPVFRKLRVTSVYEYLKLRFGVAAQLCGSILFWIQLALSAGICLYIPSLAMEVATGLPGLWSILSLGVVCACYSSIGGIRAILISNVYQLLLVAVAVALVVAPACLDAGGVGAMWSRAASGGRIDFTNLSLDPTERYTWWNLIISGVALQLANNGVNQVQVQRMMTAKSLKSARRAMVMNTVLSMLFMILVAAAGLAIYSKYYDCDPKYSGKIWSNEMLMSLYIKQTFSMIPGLRGLFIAGIFSAVLSTVSAASNSLTAITLEDYVKPLYAKCWGNELTESESIALSKVLAFIYALISIAVAFTAHLAKGLAQASFTITAIIAGPTLAVFTLGMLSESANQAGAVTGFLTSIFFLAWIAFGGPRPVPKELPVTTEGCSLLFTPNDIYKHFGIGDVKHMINTANSDHSSYFYLIRISYMWYYAIGFVVTIILGQLVSYLSHFILLIACSSNRQRQKEKQLDPDLFFSAISERIRRRRQRDADNCNRSRYADDVYDTRAVQ